MKVTVGNGTELDRKLTGCHLETSAQMLIVFLKGQGQGRGAGKASCSVGGRQGVELLGQSDAKENLSSLPCWLLSLTWSVFQHFDQLQFWHFLLLKTSLLILTYLNVPGTFEALLWEKLFSSYGVSSSHLVIGQG